MQVKLKVSRAGRDPKTGKMVFNSPGDIVIVSDGEGNKLIAKGRAESMAEEETNPPRVLKKPTPKKRTAKPKATRKTEE